MNKIGWIAAVGLACLLVTDIPAGASTTYVVDRVSDANPAGGGEGSGLTGDLRYSIVHAASGDSIVVHASGTITLSAALPQLTRSVCIQGPGAFALTVRGVGGSVLAVGPGASVRVGGLTITGGTGHGGGILNQGTLTVEDALITGNASGDPTNGDGTGAGIWNYRGAALVLRRSTVSANSALGNLSYAPSRGGGIANDGTLTLENATISGNSAVQGFGGGIANSLSASVLTLTSSTVSANTADGAGAGGGVDSRGSVSARGSIVAGNSPVDLTGGLTSGGYNVLGSVTGGGSVATDVVNAVPLLGPLQNDGGGTPTMRPLAGSPAVDRVPGSAPADFPATDQRGVARPQGTLADSGAVEVELLSPAGQAFGAEGGRGWLSVSAPRPWIAATDAPSWVTLEEPEPRSAVLWFRVSANEAASRSATLPVGGADFSIRQGGVFLDVPANHPFAAAIGRLDALGAAPGCGGGRYCPDDPISRAEAAVVLLRATRPPPVAAPSLPASTRFEDVAPENPFLTAILELDAWGAAVGCETAPPRFCPDRLLTYRELEEFLIRLVPVASTGDDDAEAGICADDRRAMTPSRESVGRDSRTVDRDGDCLASAHEGTEPVTRGEMAELVVRALAANASVLLTRMPISRPDPSGRPLPISLPVRGAPPPAACPTN